TVIVSHLGRPDGKPDPKYSLRPVYERLKELLPGQWRFVPDCVGEAVVDMTRTGCDDRGFLLLEHVRFHPEEEANDPVFAAELAASGDIFVNDAFGTAHRAHASTVGIATLLPSYAGLLMES